jgi:integrase
MTTTKAKIRKLAANPGTEGEGQAARAALARLTTSPTRRDDRQRFTERSVAALSKPETGYRLHREAPGRGTVAGFACRVMASGTRFFVVHYTDGGIEKRITIGQWPEWSVEAARIEAGKIRAKVDLGQDPIERVAGEMTVAELCDRYFEEEVQHKRPPTVKEYAGIIAHDLKPALGRRSVSSIKRRDIETLHRTVTARAPFQANRVLGVCSSMWNWAIKHELVTTNPAQKIARNHEPRRERYLSDDELAQFNSALADLDQRYRDIADLFRLTLWTGSRATETRIARWRDVDLKRAQWTKQHTQTKQKRNHIVRLSKETVELLRALRARHPGADLLFPNITDRQAVYRFKQLLAAAGVSNLRRHDLRHSFASWALQSMRNIAVVQQMLGHANLSMTQRYAHVIDEDLRAGAEAVSAKINGG